MFLFYLFIYFNFKIIFYICFVHTPMSIINATVLMLVKICHNSSKNGPLICILLNLFYENGVRLDYYKTNKQIISIYYEIK